MAGGRDLQLARLFYQIEAESKGFQSELASAERSAGRFTKFIQENPIAAAGALGAALIAVGVKATQMAAEVDSAVRKIAAVVPGATGSLDQVRKGVENLAAETGRGVQELLGVATTVARGGVRDTEELLQRLRVISQAADATGGDMNDLANSLDQVLDVFGLSGDQLEVVAAKLKAVGAGKASIEEVLGAFQAAAPTLHAAGLSFDEAASALGALVAQGLNAKQANTELKKVLEQGGIAAVRALGGAAIDTSKSLDEFREASRLVAEGAGRDAAKIEAEYTNALLEIGAAILPFVHLVVQTFATIVAEMSGKVEEFKRQTRAMRAAMDVLQLAPLNLTGQQKEIERFGKALRETVESFRRGELKIELLAPEQVQRLRDTVTQLAALPGNVFGSDQQAANELILALDKILAKRREILDAGTGAVVLPEITVKFDPKAAKAAAEKLRQQITEALTDSLPATLDATGAAIARLSAELTRAGAPADEVTKALKPLIAQLNTLRDQTLGEQIRQTLESVQLSDGDGLERQAALVEAAVQRLQELRADRVGTLGADQTGAESVQTLGEIKTLDEQIAEVNARLVALRKQAAEAANQTATADARAVSPLEEQAAAIERSKRAVTDISRGVAQVARGAIGAAQAFGGVTDATAAALQNVVSIVDTLPGIVSELSHLGDVGNVFDVAGFTAGITGLIGGIAGLASTLFGGGESPEAKRLRETLDHNAEVIAEATRRIGDFNLDISGDLFAGISKALAAAAAKFPAGLALPRPSGVPFDPSNPNAGLGTGPTASGIVAEVNRQLAALGLSMTDLKAVAKELGIELDSDSPIAFLRSLEQLNEALKATELARFTDTLQGRMQALDAEAQFFGLSAEEQLKRLAEILGEGTAQFDPTTGKTVPGSEQSAVPAIAEALQGLDLSLEKDRAELKRRLGELIKALEAGTLTPTDIGGLTPEEFLAEILKLGGFIDQAGTATDTGTTTSFAQENRITETTGQRLAGIAESSFLILREISANTEAIVAALGGAVASATEAPSATAPSTPALRQQEVVEQALTLPPELVATFDETAANTAAIAALFATLTALPVTPPPLPAVMAGQDVVGGPTLNLYGGVTVQFMGPVNTLEDALAGAAQLTADELDRMLGELLARRQARQGGPLQ